MVNHMLFKPSTVDEETHQNQGPRCEEGQFPKVLYRWSSKYCQSNDCCEVEESKHAKTKGHDKLLPVGRRVCRAFQCFILQATNKRYGGFIVWHCLDMQEKGVDLTTDRPCTAFFGYISFDHLCHRRDQEKYQGQVVYLARGPEVLN